MRIGGHGYRTSTYRCHAGPNDAPFEEAHTAPTLAVVREGRFSYHAEGGKALLQPGSILLGNPASCYSCSHEDSQGDLCTVIHFDPELVAEAGLGRRGFTRSALPPLSQLVPAIARLDRGLPDAPFHLLEAALAVCGSARDVAAIPNAREQAALRRSIERIECDFAEPLSLDDLAASAAMSRYHYLRCFKRIYTTTPYRYLLARRLTHAAEQIAQSRARIADIAFACGFGDLSTFNARFKAAFGQSPAGWRAKA